MTSEVEAKKPKLEQEYEQDFSAPWHFSDVVLVVEGRKFHVHRSTLSMWSPVFETMFTSEFKEKTSPEISLPGKIASEIEALLKLIYFKREPVTGENFEYLLKFADEYQMKEVNTLCIAYMSGILRRETALHLHALACKYNFKDFKKECLQKILFLHLDYIYSHGHFLELNMKDKYNIVSLKATAVENAFLYDKFSTVRELGRSLRHSFGFSSTFSSAVNTINGNSYKTDLLNNYYRSQILQTCSICQQNVEKQSHFYM